MLSQEKSSNLLIYIKSNQIHYGLSVDYKYERFIKRFYVDYQDI